MWHPRRESWSVVVAVATPEASRRDLTKICERLRRNRSSRSGEVKLPQLGERGYLEFLDQLAEVDLAMFATATDSGLNTPQIVQAHQAAQVADIRSNFPRMEFESGRVGMKLLADQLESLSPQLYVQLVCQVDLIDDVVRRGINYYVQRHPATLREIRWRIDQKNSTRTNFEHAFEKIAPPQLQARAIREPMFRIRGFDYRHFRKYEFPAGEGPDYLQTDYGLPPMDGFNLGKLLRGDIQFVDSKNSDGVQIADLLASGIRRALKQAFDEPLAVAAALGRLTVENMRGRSSINFVSLGLEDALPPATAEVARCIDANRRPFIYGKRQRNSDYPPA